MYEAFAFAIERAEAKALERRVQRVDQAGQGGAPLVERTITQPDGMVIHEVKRAQPQWQSDAWWLERRHPEEFALRSRLSVTHEISPALLALQQQWQALRDAPELPALPESTDYIEGEVEAEPSPQERSGGASRAQVFAMLDRLNHRRPEPEEED
jgi:hypothetical protein